MGNQLEEIFARLHGTADFADTDFSDVNATSSDGDNALHCVVRWGDLAAAKALIDAESGSFRATATIAAIS